MEYFYFSTKLFTVLGSCGGGCVSHDVECLNPARVGEVQVVNNIDINMPFNLSYTTGLFKPIMRYTHIHGQ